MDKTVTLTINEQADILYLIRLERTAKETRLSHVMGDPITKMYTEGQIARLNDIEKKLVG